MARKRERSDIILDMLNAIQHNGGMIKPTRLMYKANLSHQQMKLYLEELMQKRLVYKVREDNHEYIIITDLGCKFAEKLRQMKEFEKTFGL
ncbi:hypothetical protein J7L02_01305 [Candidatus Woesearchaeota archaeon]|nr:hypothetical protein [Candidatus Woesearchaeota archaeon]